MNVVCPICQKDDSIQKISVIVNAGQYSGSFSGPTGGITYDDGKMGTFGSYSTLSGTTVTNLAMLMFPPKEPKPGRGLGVWWILIILCSGSFLLSGLTGIFCLIPMFAFPNNIFVNSKEEALIMGIMGICLGIAFMIVSIGGLILFKCISVSKKKNGDKNYKIEKRLWDKAIAKWNRSYFCHRDDIIFDTESQEFSHLEKFQEYLFRTPAMS